MLNDSDVMRVAEELHQISAREHRYDPTDWGREEPAGNYVAFFRGLAIVLLQTDANKL